MLLLLISAFFLVYKFLHIILKIFYVLIKLCSLTLFSTNGISNVTLSWTPDFPQSLTLGLVPCHHTERYIIIISFYDVLLNKFIVTHLAIL